MEQEFDILIVGGGLAGASLARAIGDCRLRVGLLELSPKRATAPSPSFDDRGIALAAGSQRIFTAMGLWPDLAPVSCPIQHIHISDRGRFGFTRLEAGGQGVEALGHVVLARELGRVLYDSLHGLPRLHWIRPARLQSLEPTGEWMQVRIETGNGETTLKTRLLVGSDGTDSRVREALDVPVRRWDYGQHALTTNVIPGQFHQHRAFERFTATGPMALLPLDRQRCALVWTVDPGLREQLLALDEDGFRAALQEVFGFRLGRFQHTGQRHTYPLELIRAERIVGPRTALIGNAAHTLHPVAGQGFNLGLRDVAALAEHIRAGGDPGDPQRLREFAERRQPDHRAMALFTDATARVFSNPLPPLGLARDLGLLALDTLPPLKRAFARRTMGLNSRLPRLTTACHD